MITRIIHTHDTEANWNNVPHLVPKRGQVIVYDVDHAYTYERFKIGDGLTSVVDLPFVTDKSIQDFLNFDGTTCYIDGGRITDYV